MVALLTAGFAAPGLLSRSVALLHDDKAWVMFAEKELGRIAPEAIEKSGST